VLIACALQLVFQLTVFDASGYDRGPGWITATRALRILKLMVRAVRRIGKPDKLLGQPFLLRFANRSVCGCTIRPLRVAFRVFA